MKGVHTYVPLLALLVSASCASTRTHGQPLDRDLRRIAPRLHMGRALGLPHGKQLYQRHPAVAYGDGIYLVVWQEGYHGLGGDSDILGLRFDERGRPLDRRPIAICTAKGIQDSPAVAYCGRGFLVAWSDLRNGRDYDVYTASVDKEGKASKPFPFAGGKGGQANPAIASDGRSMYLVVWQDFRSGKYFEILGKPVWPWGSARIWRPTPILPRGEKPAVAWTGKHFLVCQRWYAALVDRNMKVTPAAGGKRLWNGKTVGSSTAAAAWGKGFVFFNVCPKHDPWGWGGNGAILGCTVAADGKTTEFDAVKSRRALSAMKADGKLVNCLDAARWKGYKGWPMGRPGGFKNTEEGTWPSGRVAAACNGTSIVVVWNRAHIVDKQRLANRDLYLRRVTGAWTYADKSKIKIVSGPTEEVFPVLAAGPPGHVLLAYEKLDPQGGVRIEVRMIVEGD